MRYQVLANLLFVSQKLVFISLDYPLLKLCKLNEILDCYHANIYGDEDCYYFPDEVQYAADWDQWQKILYDTKPMSRMIASGRQARYSVRKPQKAVPGAGLLLRYLPCLFDYCEMQKNMVIGDLNNCLFLPKLHPAW